MSLIVHLSDLHLLSGAPEQDAILSSLLVALEMERARRGRAIDLLVVSGDLFDSADIEPERAASEMSALLRCVDHALGRPTPTLLVPGNHDRRRIGLFGPHRPALFDALAAELPPHVFVHGTRTPFLAAHVAESFHGQPFALVAYDSSFLPDGYLSAGGVVHSEELLQMAAELRDVPPDLPLVFVLHHHLIPTPLTDTGHIETHRLPRLAHLALHRILPWLVSHADREELTMTALGAGSALSMLHSMGRAVLVLHGHKHVATARKLDAVHADDGDVLLASAGSAGTAQRWTPASIPEAARLWPSFNVLELSADALSVETVSFGYKGRSRNALSYRSLVWAERSGARWALAPIPWMHDRVGPELALDESVVTLSRSAAPGLWDASVERRIEGAGARIVRRYFESIEGAPGATLEESGVSVPLPVQRQVCGEGRASRALRGVYFRAWDQARAARGRATTPFERVTLMCRYRARTGRLVVRGLGDREVFGSVLDLGNGSERPATVIRRGDEATLEISPCPARTLLRLHVTLDEVHR